MIKQNVACYSAAWLFTTLLVAPRLLSCVHAAVLLPSSPLAQQPTPQEQLLKLLRADASELQATAPPPKADRSVALFPGYVSARGGGGGGGGAAKTKSSGEQQPGGIVLSPFLTVLQGASGYLPPAFMNIAQENLLLNPMLLELMEQVLNPQSLIEAQIAFLRSLPLPFADIVCQIFAAPAGNVPPVAVRAIRAACPEQPKPPGATDDDDAKITTDDDGAI